MKLLLTNHALMSYTGTESWVYAMAKELVKRHEVTVLSPNLGKIAEHIKTICPIITEYKGEYDCAIVNHRNTWDMLPESLPRIFTSHSKIYEIEQPPCDDYIGVNELIGGTVIRNGIDCERFKPNYVNEKLTNILLLSNPLYSGGVDFVRKAAEGYNLIVLPEETFEIEKYIEQADLVISLARGALESMASGKNVIYGDYRTGWMREFRGAGMVTENNFQQFKEGKLLGQLIPYTTEELRAEFEKYDAKRGEWLRQQILEHFNIEKTALQYEEHCRRLRV